MEINIKDECRISTFLVEEDLSQISANSYSGVGSIERSLKYIAKSEM